MALSIHGLVFYAEDGRPLLDVPAREIRRVRGAQGRDMIVEWEDERGRRRSARMRVRWAPQADRTLRPDYLLSVRGGGMRADRARVGAAYGMRNPHRRGRRTRRDYAAVRDRWLSGLEMLLAADRYAVDRRPPGGGRGGLAGTVAGAAVAAGGLSGMPRRNRKGRRRNSRPRLFHPESRREARRNQRELERFLANPPVDSPLEPAPVGAGAGVRQLRGVGRAGGSVVGAWAVHSPGVGGGGSAVGYGGVSPLHGAAVRVGGGSGITRLTDRKPAGYPGLYGERNQPHGHARECAAQALP